MLGILIILKNSKYFPLHLFNMHSKSMLYNEIIVSMVISINLAFIFLCFCENFYFIFLACFGGHTRGVQGLLLAVLSKISLSELWGLFGLPGIEFWLDRVFMKKI